MNTKMEQKTYNRKEFLELLDSAEQSASYRFMRHACSHWLAIYPGDLQIQLYNAKALLHDNQLEESESIVSKLVCIDPEFLDAYRLNQEILSQNSFDNTDVKHALFSLGVDVGGDFQPASWARLLSELRLKKLSSEEMQEKILTALNESSDQVIIAVRHLAFMLEQQQHVAAQHVSEILEKRWPDCLQFQLIKADCLIKQHQNSEGMNILQKCLSIDSVGQVAHRLWGKNHEYLKLWPTNFEVQFDLAIPAEVSAKLWGNKLGGGLGAEPEHGHGSDFSEFDSQDFQVDQFQGLNWHSRVELPPGFENSERETKTVNVESDQCRKKNFSELESLSMRLQKHEMGDARFPVYVIMSSHSNLKQKYGEKTSLVIEAEMEKLARVVSKKKGWTASLFLPDLESNALNYGINQIIEMTPWNVKLAVADLDAHLGEKGAMIGAVLIVGGDDVVPFHRLPNPTDDADSEVLSDNPYATLDANYFVPEWQVGRFPGSSDSDSGLILKQIRQSIKYHSAEVKKISWLALIENWFNTNIMGDGVSTISQRKGRNYGYSAAVWRRSSVAAFRPIGDGKDIFISPATNISKSDKAKIVSAPLSYFNLHGLADAPHWFGQKDANDRKTKEDFPIALSPSDLDQGEQLPQLVFSEACYGAFIIGKNESNSIALKFIDRGTCGFIGSTCVSYGSITTPLIGGDLIGNIFWKNVKEGYSIGEALLRAKVELVREMTRRQGFLDGEDQKTVISFVLYGDPLICKQLYKSRSKSLVRSRQVRIVKTICDRDTQEIREKHTYSHAISQAKKIMESNLPGFSNAEVHISQQHGSCDGTNHQCPNALLGKSIQSSKKSNHTVVVFSKCLDVASFKMTQYARITLDNAGKLVKMAVSR